LLGRLKQDFLPALRTFLRGSKQAFFAAGCRERNDCANTKLGRFFDGPFERVKLHDRKQQRDFNRECGRGQRLGIFDADLDPGWAATQIFSSYLGLAMLWYLHGPRFDLRRSLRQQAREFMRQWSIAK